MTSPNQIRSSAPATWESWQLTAFRIAFIFFISICVPNNTEWYKHVIHIDWFHLHYRDLYDVARFGSGLNFFGSTIFGNPLSGYANWIITLFVSVIAGLVWTFIDQRRATPPQEYNVLYYWLRAIVRYRAAIGIIGFGFTKLLPVQMPYPSTALLSTDFGDLTAQKIYWLAIGIVPWYQIFAGVVECAAGTLLFFRKTTFIGSVLLFGALGDIVYVNFAYDGGVHVYSSYFVLLSGFLLAPYLLALYRLQIQERPSIVRFYYPPFSESWKRWTRTGVKTATIFVFLILLFYLQLINFQYDPYKQPSTKGVTALRGLYDVAEFRINNKIIPPSASDTIRWQEATFEKWTTLTYKVNKPLPLDLSNGGGDPQRDINRTFEVSGLAGGRRVFHYLADTIDQILYLQDKYKAIPDRRNITAGVGGDGGSPVKKEDKKNAPSEDATAEEWISKTALNHIGNEKDKINPIAASARRDREFAKIPKNEKRNRMTLSYSTDNGDRVVLRGVDEHRDSIYVVLNRINRQYALTPSSLSAGSY